MFKPLVVPTAYLHKARPAKNPFATAPELLNDSNADRTETVSMGHKYYEQRLQEQKLEQFGIRVARDPIAGSPRTWPKVWPGDALPKLRRNQLNEKDQQAFLKELNRYRKYHGLKPVKLNKELCEAADKHSKYQAEALNSCNHYGPRGKHHWFTGRAQSAGYKGKPVNENVAAGQNTVQEALWAWHMSPGHRKTMLDPNITEIGIGFRRGKRGPYGGERWTMMTGRGSRRSPDPDRDHLA